MEPSPDLLEQQLFEQARRGDAEALENLLGRYYPQLHAFVRARMGPALRPRESSLDVVQSVCRQLLASGEPFAVQGEERFRAWLFTSALNKIRDKHRKHSLQRRDQRREETSDQGAPLAVAMHLLTPSQEAVGNETAAALEEALAALSDEHREVIALARMVKLPHRVIAEVMDRSEEATRQLLGRALLQLVRELRARGVDVSSLR